MRHTISQPFYTGVIVDSPHDCNWLLPNPSGSLLLELNCNYGVLVANYLSAVYITNTSSRPNYQCFAPFNRNRAGTAKMTKTYIPQGTTTRLTPADEVASSESALKNITGQAFREWPNEAGVSQFKSNSSIRLAKSMSSSTV